MVKEIYDVVIVGGGPAGLSAALVLGRCCREVLLCDHGQYRNAYSHAIHGFLTRDGIDPAEFRKIARDQLKRYPNVELVEMKVIDALCQNYEFTIILEDGKCILAKKVLLATGLRDEWPTFKGAKEMYGKSIFHCPYCDGWENRNKPMALLAKGKSGAEFALELTLWSPDVVLCTNGPAEIPEDYLKLLSYKNIPVVEDTIQELEGIDGILEHIVFKNGKKIPRKVLFFNTPSPQRSDLPFRLGCEFDEKEGVKVGKYERTKVPGLYVIGDATRDVLQAIVGAAEGAEAAFAINSSLLKKEINPEFL